MFQSLCLSHFRLVAYTIAISLFEVGLVSAQISESARVYSGHFRAIEPFMIQDIVVSSADSQGRRVFLLAEPPSSAFASRDTWIPNIFGASHVGHEVIKHRIGFDGYSSDLVIETRGLDDNEVGPIVAAISRQYWGTDYKASYRLYDPKPWDTARLPRRRTGPPDLQISAASLNEWLIETPDVRFAAEPLSTDDPVPIAGLFDSGKSGVFYGDPAGLVLLILPKNRPLNDLGSDIRRFFVDTDELIGAVTREGAASLALIGRERTTSISETEPLRVDTLLTLAATTEENLAQSYQRTAALAGKTTDPTLIGALNADTELDWFGERFGPNATASSTDPNALTSLDDEYRALSVAVDWAPILLSRELTHTEYGQLLNMTDQMLKGWSSANFVHYVNFPYPTPYDNPDAGGLFQRLQQQLSQPFNELTFNWNTSGFGSWSEFDAYRVFTLFRTGSLPVSYFPDQGSFTLNDETEAILKRAEDEYWSFFAGQRDPYLTRAAEYAALHVIFTSVRMRAERTEPLVVAPEYDGRWDRYARIVGDAIGAMQSGLAAGTHPLDGKQPVSAIGFGLVLDPAGACVNSSHERDDWTDDGGAEAARLALAGETDPGGAARLLIDPSAAATSLTDASGRTAADLVALQTAFNKKVEDYNRDVDACRIKSANSPGCNAVGLTARRVSLEAVEKELEAGISAYQEAQDTFWSRVDRLDDLSRKLSPFGSCRQAWRAVAEGVPDEGTSVHRTPSIVVSSDQQEVFTTGGHNLDGRAVEVIADSHVAAGKVEIDAQAGIIRMNPAEMPKAQAVVRAFERDFKRYVDGDPAFRARVETRVQAALAEDLRAVQAYDDLVLARVGFDSQGNRGLVVRETASPVGVTRVLTRPAAQRMDAETVATLAEHAVKNDAQMVIRTLDDGMVELSFPGGRPPVSIRAGSRDALQAGIEDMVEHVIRSGDVQAGSVAIVDYGGRTSLGDLLALKYSAEGRTLPRTAAGGGGIGAPPRGPRGFLADAEPPKGTGGNRSGGKGGHGGDPPEAGGVGKTPEGGPRKMIAFFSRKGDPLEVLMRTDANWSAAVLDRVAVQTLGDHGLLSAKLVIPFRKPETPTLSAKLKSIFWHRKATVEDSTKLSRAVEKEFARSDAEPLWKRLEDVRTEFLSAYPKGDAPWMIWDLTDSAQDILVVEEEEGLPDGQPVAISRG